MTVKTADVHISLSIYTMTWKAYKVGNVGDFTGYDQSMDRHSDLRLLGTHALFSLASTSALLVSHPASL